MPKIRSFWFLSSSRFLKPVPLASLWVILGTFVCMAGEPDRPKVAVVLSGGGAKGFAHIGVLKVLEEEGIPIDIIVGTSMGSIVGGLYSIGYSADEIANMSLSQNWTELLSDYIPRKQLDPYSRIEQERYLLTLPIAEGNKPVLPNGLIKGQNVLNLFCGLTANVPVDADFNTFPIAFACIGADLETGEEVVMNSGFLPTAIFSSMAIPGVFVPGEHNGHLLVDGGIVNNFPTDIAQKMGADIIIGVDIRTDLHKAEEIVSMNKLMDQLINFYTLDKDSVNKSLCDIIIRPDITGYSVSSFYTEAVDTLITKGILATEEVMDDIRKLRSTYDLKPKSVPRDLTTQKEWTITGISVSSEYQAKEKLITDDLELEIPGKYSYNDIKRSINYLYSSNNFKRVYFNLDPSNQDKILNITPEEEKAWHINVGMRLNTNSAVSVLLNSTKKDYSKTFDLLSLSVDLSSNPQFTFLTEMGIKKLPKVALLIDGSYNELTAHLSNDYAYAANIYLGKIQLYTYQRISRYSLVGAGIKQEFYSGRLYDMLGDSSLSMSANDKALTHFYCYLNYDNLDNYYYPTKGTEAYAELSLVQDFDFNNTAPVALFKMRNVIRMNSSLAVLVNLSGRTILSDNYPQYIGNFLVAKDYEANFNHHLPFYGLPTLWSTEKNVFIGLIGLRIKTAKNQYLKTEINYMIHNQKLSGLTGYKSLWGCGLTYAYNSMIGPVEFSIAYSNGYDKLLVSANVGFWF